MKIENVIYNMEVEEEEEKWKERILQSGWGFLMDIAAEVRDIIRAQIIVMQFEPAIPIDQLAEKLPEAVKEWEKMYWEVAKAHIEDEEALLRGQRYNNLKKAVIKIRKKPEFTVLSNLWIYCCFNQNEMLEQSCLVDMYYKKYKTECLDYESRKENMLDYIICKVPYELEREQLKLEVDEYEMEILQIVKDMEQGKLQEKVNSLCAMYPQFVKELTMERENTKEE